MGRILALVIAAACILANAAARVGTTRVAEGVYALQLPARGQGDDVLAPARVTYIAGPRGVVVVDSGMSHLDGEAILATIRRATQAPVRLAILTHPSQEAIFGATAFQERGIPVAMHRDAAALVSARCGACLQRLRTVLGDAAMGGTRVVVPDRLLEDDEVVHDAGRPLRILAPPASSAPGAIAVLDERTGTLVAGSIVSIRAVPDLRDGSGSGWRAALDRLDRTRCVHLVPAYGSIGSCADIAPLARYLDDLEQAVASLLAQGVDLGELDAKADLPAYASWMRYSDLHRANAARVYLRLERAQLAHP
ncbi:MAG TPA: MBL fold metallo-hydrolase [Usitatibacter sp.]|jgi:glyoxylase-like metal-dependent hydrolase (beta-lactamase superfamily II)|nr:MBL fold metallo-hydrolase [Usitatibacter sp.]